MGYLGTDLAWSILDGWMQKIGNIMKTDFVHVFCQLLPLFLSCQFTMIQNFLNNLEKTSGILGVRILWIGSPCKQNTSEKISIIFSPRNGGQIGHDDVTWLQVPECFEASYCIQYFVSFVKNRSCVTQICITKIAAKCILVVVVKWRHHANVLFVLLRPL